jgi:hypothetical protein
MPSKLSENLRVIRESNRERINMYIPEWKENLPEGSQWFPGSTGKPACKLCNGLGWLRRDWPIGHPDFGKLVACDCTR